jgi:RsiW-degrading membrane proteinase PrsW (M82 family)
MDEAFSLRAVRLTAAAVCAFGAAVLGWQFRRFLPVYPLAAVLSVLLELPFLAFGVWVLRLLRPIRPPEAIWSAAAIVWGATAATGCALLADRGLTALWAKTEGIAFAANWSASLSAPLNEEILKACGVIMIVLAAPRVIRGPVDGMVYGALTGLGFQVLENVTYGLNNIVQAGATDPVDAVISSVLVRVGVTALGSHWAMTAVAGTGIGFLVGRGRYRVPLAVGCLLLAMAMHLQFDAPHPSIPVKVLVNFVVVAVLYLLVSQSYLTRAREVLGAEAAAGTITKAEAAGFLSRRFRRAELRRAGSAIERDQLTVRQQRILARIDLEAA